jgi:hypothetical protein
MDSVNVLLIDVLIITTYTRQVGILKFEFVLNQICLSFDELRDS